MTVIPRRRTYVVHLHNPAPLHPNSGSRRPPVSMIVERPGLIIASGLPDGARQPEESGASSPFEPAGIWDSRDEAACGRVGFGHEMEFAA
jgi:hypothetical protein